MDLITSAWRAPVLSEGCWQAAVEGKLYREPGPCRPRAEQQASGQPQPAELIYGSQTAGPAPGRAA